MKKEIFIALNSTNMQTAALNPESPEVHHEDHGNITSFNLKTGQLNKDAAFQISECFPKFSGNIVKHLGNDEIKSALHLIPNQNNFDIDLSLNVKFKKWKLSRFTYFLTEQGKFMAKNPRSDCFAIIKNPRLLAVLMHFKRAKNFKKIFKKYNFERHLLPIKWLLARAKIIIPCDENDLTQEDQNENLRQWEFHDLLFHSQSRLGLSAKNIGGTFRFKGSDVPEPKTIKTHNWNDLIIPLPKPDINLLRKVDFPLTTILEERSSKRKHSHVPIDIKQLGYFLFRTSRIRGKRQTEMGEFVSKPYPSGGGIYETEIYLTINHVKDLKRGLYYYDSFNHNLCLVTGSSQDLDGLIQEAAMASGYQGIPQIVITLSSRFHRMNWKYSGISYATQLKNIGSIYQTFYLVATAMNLAACGLGTGDSKRFSKLTGINLLEEGSIGEFMLGRPI